MICFCLWTFVLVVITGIHNAWYMFFFLNLKPKDRNRSHNLNSLPWLLKLQSLICLFCLIGRFDLIGGIGSWMKSYQASMCAMKKVQSTTVSKPPWRRIQIRGLIKYTHFRKSFNPLFFPRARRKVLRLKCIETTFLLKKVHYQIFS